MFHTEYATDGKVLYTVQSKCKAKILILNTQHYIMDLLHIHVDYWYIKIEFPSPTVPLLKGCKRLHPPVTTELARSSHPKKNFKSPEVITLASRAFLILILRWILASPRSIWAIILSMSCSSLQRSQKTAKNKICKIRSFPLLFHL